VLRGSETPRLFTPPVGPLTPATSKGFEANTFAEDVLGVDLMPWQKWVLIHLLELAPQGGFRFRTALILCARQQGKTVLLQILALWRLYLDRAGLVIGSAQQLALAEETWAGGGRHGPRGARPRRRGRQRDPDERREVPAADLG